MNNRQVCFFKTIVSSFCGCYLLLINIKNTGLLLSTVEFVLNSPYWGNSFSPTVVLRERKDPVTFSVEFLSFFLDLHGENAHIPIMPWIRSL